MYSTLGMKEEYVMTPAQTRHDISETMYGLC